MASFWDDPVGNSAHWVAKEAGNIVGGPFSSHPKKKGGGKAKPAAQKAPAGPPPDPVKTLSDQVMNVLNIFGKPQTASQAHQIALGMQTLGITDPKDPKFLPFLLLQSRSSQGQNSPIDQQTLYMQALAPYLQSADKQFAGLAHGLGAGFPGTKAGAGQGLAQQAMGQAKSGAGAALMDQQNMIPASIAYDQMISQGNNILKSNQSSADLISGLTGATNPLSSSLFGSAAGSDPISQLIAASVAKSLGQPTP